MVAISQNTIAQILADIIGARIGAEIKVHFEEGTTNESACGVRGIAKGVHCVQGTGA